MRWTLKFTKAKRRDDGTIPATDLVIPFFGYKSHISIDRKFRLIRKWKTTDAAANDGARLREGLLDKTNTASSVWADTAYRSKANEGFPEILGRSASEDIVHYFQERMADGEAYNTIRRETAFSQEANKKVAELYQNVLGRGADQRGLKTYQDQLAVGRSLTDVRHDLAYSAEATAHLQRLVSTLVAPDAWNDKLAILQQDLATKDSLLYILGHPDNFIGVRLEDLYISYEPYPETLSKFFGVNPENGKQNCIFCTNAMIARIYSKDANAVAPLSDVQGYEAFDPRAYDTRGVNIETVERFMKKLGNGDARALTLFAPDDEKNGHAIVAYNDNGVIRYLDGQKGWEVKLQKNLKISIIHRTYVEPDVI